MTLEMTVVSLALGACTGVTVDISYRGLESELAGDRAEAAGPCSLCRG